MDTSKLEKQDEENVVNQEIGADTDDQKSQSIDTLILETQPIHKEKQTDSNKE